MKTQRPLQRAVHREYIRAVETCEQNMRRNTLRWKRNRPLKTDTSTWSSKSQETLKQEWRRMSRGYLHGKNGGWGTKRTGEEAGVNWEAGRACGTDGMRGCGA
eukprot:760267-Hanusia_phi.AAC.5